LLRFVHNALIELIGFLNSCAILASKTDLNFMSFLSFSICIIWVTSFSINSTDLASSLKFVCGALKERSKYKNWVGSISNLILPIFLNFSNSCRFPIIDLIFWSFLWLVFRNNFTRLWFVLGAKDWKLDRRISINSSTLSVKIIIFNCNR